MHFFTSIMCRISYHRPPPRQLPPPYSSTAWPRPCSSLLGCTYKSTSPACHTAAGWISSRIGHRSPLVALCNPSYSSTAFPQGRGKHLKTSHNTCGYQSCKLRLGSFSEYYSSLVLVFSCIQLASDHIHHSLWISLADNQTRLCLYK